MIPSSDPNRPHANCYWVNEYLMAGEYPIERDPEVALRKLNGILKAGISEFLDLTDPLDGLNPYHQLSACQPFGHRQMTIRDMDVPTPESMRQILDHLKARLDLGQKVYVHCWGGIGRTGTVVGCHLVEQGMTAPQALDHIARRWQTMEKIVRFPRSPQTDAQVEFVRSWERRLS